MQKNKITFALIIALVTIVGIGYYLTTQIGVPLSQNINPDLPANNSPELLAQKAQEIAQLTVSPISKSTAGIFSFLNGTTSKVRSEVLSKPPFTKEAAEKLTNTKLQSGYLVIGGREIPGVGAEIFITFPAEPDTIFRAAFQNTYQKDTPFTLVNFDVTTEKAEDIAKFLGDVTPFLNEIEKTSAKTTTE